MSFGGISRASLAAIAVACSFAAAEAQPARMVTFDIPAQPLPSALTMFARQARVQVLFPSALIATRRASGLKGIMSPQIALSRLIAGSGLIVAQDDGQTVVLKAQPVLASDVAPGSGALDAQARDDQQPDASSSSTGQDDAKSTDQASDILVVGTRKQATDLKLNANNTVDVLSSEDLSHTAVHNVAEALALLPSVNVIYTGSGFFGGVDGASRGDGQFVSIRGLNGEYNVNLINGAEAAVANPYSRSVELSLIPPSGLKTIVLNKTSRADMDGDAIGGTIDFRTPSAFDYGSDTTGSLTGGGRLESRARAYGLNALGYNAAGEISHKFGSARQFGIYVSGYYDIRHFDNSTIGGIQESGCCDNGTDFAVQDASGNSAPGLDPAKNLILTGANFGVSNGYTERYGGTLLLTGMQTTERSFICAGHTLTRRASRTAIFPRSSRQTRKTAPTARRSAPVSMRRCWAASRRNIGMKPAPKPPPWVPCSLVVRIGSGIWRSHPAFSTAGAKTRARTTSKSQPPRPAARLTAGRHCSAMPAVTRNPC